MNKRLWHPAARDLLKARRACIGLSTSRIVFVILRAMNAIGFGRHKTGNWLTLVNVCGDLGKVCANTGILTLRTSAACLLVGSSGKEFKLSISPQMTRQSRRQTKKPGTPRKYHPIRASFTNKTPISRRFYFAEFDWLLRAPHLIAIAKSYDPRLPFRGKNSCFGAKIDWWIRSGWGIFRQFDC